MKMLRSFFVLLIFVAAFVLGFSLLQPTTLDAAGPTTGGILYVVRYGDSLESIASRFGVSVQAIMQANGMNANYAYVGQQMYLPPGNYAPQSAPYGSPSTGYDTNYSNYLVQSGDTLASIAARYGLSEFALMQANYLYNPSYVYVGMNMRIPPIAPVSSQHVAFYQTYVVQPSDTLTSIGLRFGTTTYALMIANNLPDANMIYAGLRLNIPGSSSYVQTRPTPYTNNYRPPTYITPTPRAIMPTPGVGYYSMNTAAVAIRNMAFTPTSMAVRVGTVVTWQNLDTTAHTVTSGTPGGPNGLFDSGPIDPGQVFQYQFNRPGTYYYYCAIHGVTMTASVTVAQ